MRTHGSLAALAALLIAGPAFADWKPSKPVTIIVPWAAGGSTDQVTRVTAGEIETALGQKVVIVNQPGASGSIGTKNAVEAQKDGYTWTAGAAQDLGVYKVLGMLDTNITDWHLFLNVANVSVVGVNPSAPFKDMKEPIDAMKAKPDQITVATAGLTSAGHKAMESIARATGVTYRHVTYDGGNPAVVATVAGETLVTTQLAVEQAEMIRGKRIRPLATVGDKPLAIEGFGTIPPMTTLVPNFSAPTNYFGIFVPKGVPQEVVDALNKIWKDNIAKSAALRNYAENRGALFAPATGDEAQKLVFPAIQSMRGPCRTPARRRFRPTRSAFPSHRCERGGGPSAAGGPHARGRDGRTNSASNRFHLRPRLDRLRRGDRRRLVADGPARIHAHQPVHGTGAGDGNPRRVPVPVRRDHGLSRDPPGGTRSGPRPRRLERADLQPAGRDVGRPLHRLRRRPRRPRSAVLARCCAVPVRAHRHL